MCVGRHRFFGSGQCHVAALFLATTALLAACDTGSQNGAAKASTAPAACASAPGRVSLPGGTFAMGAADAYPEEAPVRTITVAAFSIDRTEVTNAQFADFVTATGHVTQAERSVDGIAPGSAVFISPLVSGSAQWWQFVEGADWRHPEGPGSTIKARMHHPVVHVSHADAAAFADWAGGRLPTEAEWEYAARGGLAGARYEWGEEPPETGPPKANTWQGAFPLEDSGADGYAGTAPVGCFPANGFGLHDMTGNVWEWTSGQFDPVDRNSGTIRGGSWLCAQNFCRRYRPAARHPQERDFSTSHLGFRVVYEEDGR